MEVKIFSQCLIPHAKMAFLKDAVTKKLKQILQVDLWPCSIILKLYKWSQDVQIAFVQSFAVVVVGHSLFVQHHKTSFQKCAAATAGQ